MLCECAERLLSDLPALARAGIMAMDSAPRQALHGGASEAGPPPMNEAAAAAPAGRKGEHCSTSSTAFYSRALKSCPHASVAGKVKIAAAPTGDALLEVARLLYMITGLLFAPAATHVFGELLSRSPRSSSHFMIPFLSLVKFSRTDLPLCSMWRW